MRKKQHTSNIIYVKNSKMEVIYIIYDTEALINKNILTAIPKLVRCSYPAASNAHTVHQ